jgi:hypothetical protein
MLMLTFGQDARPRKKRAAFLTGLIVIAILNDKTKKRK